VLARADRRVRRLPRAAAQSDIAFGAFLDPVADKLMVTAALLVPRATDAAERGDCAGYRGREITISALREMDGADRASKSVA